MTHEDRTKVWTKDTLNKETAKDFQMMVRLESANSHGLCRCVTCGSTHHYKDIAAGHYLPELSVKFVRMNCHPQCVECNRWKASNREKYTAFMLRTYGADRVARLELAQSEAADLSRYRLLGMRSVYRKACKELFAALRWDDSNVSRWRGKGVTDSGYFEIEIRENP